MQDDTDDPLARHGRIAMPASFYSLETGGPFTRCLQCGRELLDGSTRYMIERVFRGTEPIIEYAMCESCLNVCQGEMSTESREAVREFLLRRVNYRTLITRGLPRLLLAEDSDRDRSTADTARSDTSLAPWTGRCIVSGRDESQCHERQIMGWCEGRSLLVGQTTPLMISGQALEELHAVLSEKTKGWMRDFIGDRFGMPPEFCGDPSEPLLPVIL